MPKRVHKPDISTPARKKAVEYEEEIRNESREIGVFIDHKGEVILHLNGDANSVGVPEKYWGIVRNSTFTHNHPGGSNFSFMDIITAGEFDLHEIRAVTSDFRFSMRKAEGSRWVNKTELYQAFPILNEQARDLTRDLTRNLINTDQTHLKYAHIEVEHQLWILISKKFGLIYKRERS